MVASLLFKKDQRMSMDNKRRPPLPKKPPPGSQEKQAETRPVRVIADISFKDGMFFVSVENISDQPVYQVKIKWEPPFRGLGGVQITSELALFHNIEFLAPHKAITTLLDTSQAYFQRGEPTRLTALVQYLDEQGKPGSHTFQHHLEIYRDLAYLDPN
jgi:hypothetical protein